MLCYAVLPCCCVPSHQRNAASGQAAGAIFCAKCIVPYAVLCCYAAVLHALPDDLTALTTSATDTKNQRYDDRGCWAACFTWKLWTEALQRSVAQLLNTLAAVQPIANPAAAADFPLLLLLLLLLPLLLLHLLLFVLLASGCRT